MDKRDGHIVKVTELIAPVGKRRRGGSDSPMIYAILPIIPLALILIFSDLWISWIKMDIIKAMFIGMAIGMIFEFVRLHDGKKVLGDIQVFFDGLGAEMA